MTMVVCSPVFKILRGQGEIEQRWHGKLANWLNSPIKVNKI